ncbi:VOC family protein [Thalassotalea sp. G2M2-11]|uniref:VOC family protein n=1 Tax=Thalassotalea sp. G2M2-11 TaxID=2787627 RepID=UPI0019D2F3A9
MSIKLDYVEFPAIDLDATKQFFSSVFGWDFQDFGPEYSSFTNQGLNGGFFQSDLTGTTATGSALLVFYYADLEDLQAKVVQAGGQISKDIFSFPGGRRFHFIEPSGNEFAVWTDK